LGSNAAGNALELKPFEVFVIRRPPSISVVVIMESILVDEVGQKVRGNIRSHQDINVPNREDIKRRYIIFVHPIPLHGRPFMTEEPFKPVHGSD
jgi:hypothetical protein